MHSTLFPHILLLHHLILRTKQTAERSSSVFRNALNRSVPEEEWPVEEFTYLTPIRWPYSTTQDRRPEVERYWRNADPEYVDGPGAESFENFIERVRSFLDRLKNAEEAEEAVVVFSHEQFIDAVRWLIDCKPTEISSRTMRGFRRYLDSHDIPNGGMVWLRFHPRENRWRYELITSHLKCLESIPSSVVNAIPVAAD